MTEEYLGKNRRVLAWAETRDRDGVPTEGMAIKYDNDYVGWCPKDIFEQRNMSLDKLDFSGALYALKEGHALAHPRLGGFVVLMTALSIPAFSTQEPGPKVNDRTAKWIGPDKPLESQPYFSFYEPYANKWTPGWQPTARDMLAEDWFIENPEDYFASEHFGGEDLDETHNKG